MQNTIQLTIICVFVAFFITLLFAPIVFKFVKRLKANQPILNYVKSHQSKSGTPTMGGLMFLFGVLATFLMFANYEYVKYSLICLCCFVGFGLVGFLDDYIKIKYNHNEGLKPYQKVIGQVGVAVIVSVFCYLDTNIGGEIVIPFTNNVINIGWWIIPFCIFVFIAISNSVNLTDGLDGLASGVSVSYLTNFAIIIGIVLSAFMFNGENLIIINEYKNLLLLIGSVIGALLAFISLNFYPAKIFMGDVGSLSIGGLIAGLVAVTKFYLLMPILGVMFVVSAVSVIIQVVYYKLTHKRVFLMAPLHHHFELKGCYETKIVVIYILITIITGLTCIALYL